MDSVALPPVEPDAVPLKAAALPLVSACQITPEWPEAKIKRLLGLHASGLCYSAIATQLGGCTRSAVAGKIKRLGLASASPVLRVPRKPKAAAPPVTRGVNTYGGMATKLAHAKRKEKAAFGIAAPWTPEARIVKQPPQPRLRCEPEPIPVTACSIYDLTTETCRWPVGPDTGRGQLFCGAPGADLAAQMPYCGNCAPRAFTQARWRP